MHILSSNMSTSGVIIAVDAWNREGKVTYRSEAIGYDVGGVLGM